MNRIKYSIAISDHFLTSLVNILNEELGNSRYEVPSIIRNFSRESQEEKYDINTLKNIEDYLIIIVNFKDILESKLPHCKHTNFYQRLKNLVIEEFVVEDNLNSNGQYDVLKNKLNIYKTKEMDIVSIEHIIFHELLHLATTYKYKNIVMCGFSQCTVLKNYFDGLNEGYTEVLNLRYFSTETKHTGSYQLNQLLALGIEEIVGKDKMEELYFDANLDGLLDELSQYATLDEIYDILKNMDVIKKLQIGNYGDEKSLASAVELSLKTGAKIANIKQRQNRILYEHGEITQEEYEFQSLKTALYVYGIVLEKEKNGYKLTHPATEEQFVSKDAYRIIKEHFFNSEESKKEYTAKGYEVVITAPQNTQSKNVEISYGINNIMGYTISILEIEQEEKIDLSTVATIKLFAENKKIKHKIIPITQETSSDDNKVSQSQSQALYIKK